MFDTFSDLPDALVKDLLTCAVPVAEDVRKRIETLKASQNELRDVVRGKGLIKRKADLDIPREPSVSGIDGSYQIHRLTSLDLCAAAAVAVEGTSKEAKRYWPEPYHRMWSGGIPHNDSTTGVLRGLMIGMELDLAKEAPHDLVLLDGSFASLIIYLNQGLISVKNVSNILCEVFWDRWVKQDIFQRLLDLMRSERVVAAPKFTSRNELIAQGILSCVDGIDGRTLATILLDPGEYTNPLPIYKGSIRGVPELYHFPLDVCPKEKQQDMNQALHEIEVIYFRPYGWAPALRLELPGPIVRSLTRLSIVLEGIVRQYFSPAVVEPYPLFLADRMVKSLGAGVSVIEQTVAQNVVDSGVDIELTMLCLQNYRTEGGRGGV